jgi:hypothetical protein
LSPLATRDSIRETARSMLVAWTFTPRMLTQPSLVRLGMVKALVKISHP